MGEHVVYRNCFWRSEQLLYPTYSPHVLLKKRASHKDLPVQQQIPSSNKKQKAETTVTEIATAPPSTSQGYLGSSGLIWFAKGGFFSESLMNFLDLQIYKKKIIPKNYPDLEI